MLRLLRSVVYSYICSLLLLVIVGNLSLCLIYKLNIIIDWYPILCNHYHSIGKNIAGIGFSTMWSRQLLGDKEELLYSDLFSQQICLTY